MFFNHWRENIANQSKLRFYAKVKHEFGEEAYLSLNNRAHRVQISKLRSSSHDLLIEKGRYGVTTSNNISGKACRFCCVNDNVMHLEQLPFFEQPIIESEEHVLNTCPFYDSIRAGLSDNLKCLLMLKEYGLIMSSAHSKEFGRYLFDCFKVRNPEPEKD